MSNVKYVAVNRNAVVSAAQYFWAAIKGPIPAMLCTSAAKNAGVLLFPNSGATGAVQATSSATGVATALGGITGDNGNAVAMVLTSAGANDSTVNAYFYGAGL
jgi:hypothetical protein